jgi:RHS repeat-associated protein
MSRLSANAALMVTPVASLLDAYTSFGQPATYFADGALKSVGTESYVYNAFGEVVELTVGTTKKRYTYDALGRRISETKLAPGAVATTLYGYDGPRRLLRKLPWHSNWEVTIDGQGLDQHLVRVDPDAAQSKFYFHQDRTNSVYLVSDGSGQPIEWYQYSAYGDMTIVSPTGGVLGSSYLYNRFGYQGQAFDTATGLVDMRARFYKPSWGRFVTPDPIGLAGGPNLYAFVGSAPTKWWDPMGLDHQAYAGHYAVFGGTGGRYSHVVYGQVLPDGSRYLFDPQIEGIISWDEFVSRYGGGFPVYFGNP